ncbi:MAG: toll/interleukin-1 receptor domain-containing protein [Bacteroidia bacterium]|nr:toll/interleukin-1 receptor domain-containing protein [Bacteroidia bacterium]
MMSSPEQLNWKVIADELKSGDLIPVVGPELLQVEHNGRVGSYRLWLATELARELGISQDGLDDILHPVEEVMLRFYQQGDIRSIRPYQVVKALISETQFPIPEAIKKLAQIKRFRFFMTTTYEPFLETAVKEAWGMNDSQIRILENNLTKQPDDITKFTQRSALQQFDPRYIENLYKSNAPPSIYYLYGRPSRMKSYALSEDDVLEANLMLQSSIYRPDELINFLSGKRMLILGCNFPNWLARFFIALTSPDPKKPSIQPVFVMSDTVCRTDQNLTGYLKRLDAQVVLDTSVESFVDRLFELYQGIGSYSSQSSAEENPFGRGSIFISYASEDREAANQLFEEIRSIGLPVWLDKRALKAGEEWESLDQRPRRQPLRRRTRPAERKLPENRCQLSVVSYPLTDK